MSIPPFPKEPYAAVSVDELEAELIVVIRHRGVQIADLKNLFDSSYAALGQAAKAGLFVPDGPALAVYYGDPMQTFDLEIGYPAMSAPTAAIDSPAGRIHASALPAGRAAFLSHIGSYEGLGQAWQALAEGAPGSPEGVWIEAYISDPSRTPAEELRTDLVLPLKD